MANPRRNAPASNRPSDRPEQAPREGATVRDRKVRFVTREFVQKAAERITAEHLELIKDLAK